MAGKLIKINNVRPSLEEYGKGSALSEMDAEEFKRGPQKKLTPAEVIPPYDPSSDPDIQAIFNQMMAEIDKETKELSDKLSIQITYAVNASDAQDARAKMSNSTSYEPVKTYQPKYPAKNLPWFKHGIKGFFNKLWYGNHPTNPMYAAAEQAITLEQYNSIDNDLTIGIEGLLVEINAMPLAGEIQILVNRFKDNIAKTFKSYFIKAVEVSQQKRATPTVAKPELTPAVTKPTRKRTAPKFQPGLFDKTNKPATSTEWYNKVLPIHDEVENLTVKKENRRLRQELPNWLDDDRIADEKRKEAFNFMKEQGMDPCNTEDIRLICPDHADHPITDDPSDCERDRLEHEEVLVSSILENASLDTKIRYYRYLIEVGL